MKILISGSSGLVGSYLYAYLSGQGHDLARLVRDPSKSSNADIAWDPARSELDSTPLQRFQAIIHLSGENLSNRLWTKKQKARIKNSRVDSTRLLARAISELPDPKPVFLSASATGFYGDRGDDIVDEQSPPGNGFLSEVVREWEAAADAARHSGARVVHLRFGIIISKQGGILRKLLPVFRLGFGGKLGGGRQYMPWIALEDVAGISAFCLDQENIEGPVNVVAPEALTNGQFTDILADVLSRPAFFGVPAAILKKVLGELAEELFFSSTRVEPKVLVNKGYKYRYPQLEVALKSMLS